MSVIGGSMYTPIISTCKLLRCMILPRNNEITIHAHDMNIVDWVRTANKNLLVFGI